MQLVGFKKNKYFFPQRLKPSLNILKYNFDMPVILVVSYEYEFGPFEYNCVSFSSLNSILIKLSL